ncbi:S-layer homology domain-containing protein [Paenibacillus profundus]|uniref:S-layer homology domain-containing protein n=1 Tax=Paenibacillus profundus TaxID=1173085 RepID=A0ABS8YFK3_9BACL|nr:S-layer homology domain-containing protein [Paenibacillus profundus]MCE5169116.1 S-layer homology domain-containing protein [Paenibacillus profundus]
MIARKIARKVLTIVLMISLMFASIGVAFGQTIYSDIEGHWAENQLRNWIAQGLIKGYPDGSLKPNNTITRGEFMALVNRLFQFNQTTNISFTDMKESNWEYTEVQKAVKEGYIQGYEDKSIRSSKFLSRQEAAVLVANLLNMTNEEQTAHVFKDASSIASWSKGAVGATASKNIIIGYSDHTFKPKVYITRAEAVVMLDRAKSSTPETPTNNNGKTPTPETKPEVNSKTELESKSESKTKTEIEIVYISESKSESESESKPESKPEPEPALPTVTGVTYTTTIENSSTTGVAQVATLTIMNDAVTAGTLRATFTDGMTPVSVNVTLTGAETTANVATEIATAFGSTIKGWNVTANGENVLFTADAPAANNANVKATVEDIATGVGTLSSAITTSGVAAIAGTAQVATLSITNGAKVKDSFYAEFTDGTPPVRVKIDLAGTETAEEVAEKIAAAFGSSIPGWKVTTSGSDVQFTAQTPATNNENVSVIVFEASGVGAPRSTITAPGDLGSNTSQVVTLTLPRTIARGGPVGVKFTDGVASVTVNVMTLDTETVAQLADKIAAAFGSSIPGWNVSTNSSRVLFTANAPAANNTKAVARLSGDFIGIGMPDSTITTLGDATASTGIEQVVTLAVLNGATDPGSLYVNYTDGTTPVSENVPIVGTETTEEVANAIAMAFGTSISGWDVTASGANVKFTAQASAANNDNVAVTVEEMLTGVGTPSSTITTAGAATTVGGTKVATLTITNGAKAAGKLHVTFTDGSEPISVNVTLTGTESAANVATKIAEAFGNTITGWNVATSDTRVLFTANTPDATHTNVKIMIQE